VTGKRGSPLPRRAAASAASGASRAEAPKPGHKDVPRVAPAEAHPTAPATTVTSLVIGPRSVGSHDAARPTSHRWMRSQLCSWHMQASSYLQWHRPQWLTGVYYIPALGQLDESGSRVEIKDGVMRIWDRHHHLLAKVSRGTNRLYVLNVQVAQPLCLAAHRDDKAWQWHERFGHLHFETLKRLSAKGMVRDLPSRGGSPFPSSRASEPMSGSSSCTGTYVAR
jgi:hypothetical protein